MNKHLTSYSILHGPTGRVFGAWTEENIAALWAAIPERLTNVGNTGSSYTAALPGFTTEFPLTELALDKLLWFTPHVDNNPGPTLTIDGIPTKPIVMPDESLPLASDFVAGNAYLLRVRVNDYVLANDPSVISGLHNLALLVLRKDGSVELTADWPIGMHHITTALPPAAPEDLANKQYVDETDQEISDALQVIRDTKADIASPTFTGIPLTPAPSPSADDTQIPTTAWVRDRMDEIAAGVLPASPVRLLAETGSLATGFENGDTADGLVLATGDSFLYQPMAGISSPDPTVGVYVVQASGAAVRRSDFDTGAEFPNRSVFVNAGSHAGESWKCANSTPPNVGVDPISFVKYSSTQTITLASQAEAEAGVENTKPMPSLRVRQAIDTRLPAMGAEGTQADPALARGGSGVHFDSTNRKMFLTVGEKGHATLSPLDALVMKRVTGGVKVGLADNFESGIPSFQIDNSVGSPKIFIEGVIKQGADDAIDDGVRRFDGTRTAPRGMDASNIGHISSRDYDQFAPIWSDNQGLASPAPWFPPEFQLGGPILAYGTPVSAGNFSLTVRQHTSGLPNTPIDGHRYFIYCVDMAQASIPVNVNFRFNGVNYPAKKDGGTQFGSTHFPRSGIWRFNAAAGEFWADVDSHTNLGDNNLNVFYRKTDGGAKNPLYGRSWSRTVWVASTPDGINREGIVTFEVTPRGQMISRVSLVLAGKGILSPGGGMYYDKKSDDGFFAPDNYPRDGTADQDGPFYNGDEATGNLLDPLGSNNTKAISPGADTYDSVNHMNLAPFGAVSALMSNHTRFPGLALREGVHPLKGLDISFDLNSHEALIKGVDAGGTDTVTEIILDKYGNVQLKFIDSLFEDQDVILVEGNTRLNGFHTVHPNSRNEFALHGTWLSSADLANANTMLGTTTVRRVSNSTLATIGYSGTNKNIWKQKIGMDWGDFSTTGVTSGKRMRATDGWRLDSSRAGGGTQIHQQFFSTSGLAGSITSNAATAAFNPSSDRRLKKNLVEFKDSGKVIDKIKIWKFNWKGDNSIGYGPMAQELHKVFPYAAQRGGRNPRTDSWKWTPDHLIPVLLAEAKESRRREKLLLQRMAKLEQQIANLR